MGEDADIFVCPSATLGWPHAGGAFRYTYRPAAINQPSGSFPFPKAGTYVRESFGFMDGRILKRFMPEYEGSPIHDAEEYAKTRATFLRDLIVREGPGVAGPHGKGMNVLNRDLQVEYRTQKEATEDLAPNFSDAGSQF